MSDGKDPWIYIDVARPETLPPLIGFMSKQVLLTVYIRNKKIKPTVYPARYTYTSEEDWQELLSDEDPDDYQTREEANGWFICDEGSKLADDSIAVAWRPWPEPAALPEPEEVE